MRQHTNMPSRPIRAVSLLLAVILPASLAICGFAAADTATNGSSVADASAPATLEGTGGGGSSDPSRS
ncbi:hypothetical protein [Bifidobacterium mizhiense]|uniref:hypothetical protein n=1 Tax=Bifidobacterium mizhiense TaxID=2879940 RepID=UPI001E2BD3FA|nr:hypothetical protein [Bifidobacterium mizhiense]